MQRLLLRQTVALGGEPLLRRLDPLGRGILGFGSGNLLFKTLQKLRQIFFQAFVIPSRLDGQHKLARFFMRDDLQAGKCR